MPDLLHAHQTVYTADRPVFPFIMQEQDYLNYFPSPVYPVHNEIGNLYDSFQSMSQRTLTLVEQLKEYSKKEAKQQLALLHAQLNPHFLYNTLDSIQLDVPKWKCRQSTLYYKCAF